MFDYNYTMIAYLAAFLTTVAASVPAPIECPLVYANKDWLAALPYSAAADIREETSTDDTTRFWSHWYKRAEGAVTVSYDRQPG